MGNELLPFPLTERSVHLCIDMQRIFSVEGVWPTPWMDRVLPIVATLAERYPERTIFTRFILPERPDQINSTRQNCCMSYYADDWRFGDYALMGAVLRAQRPMKIFKPRSRLVIGAADTLRRCILGGAGSFLHQFWPFDYRQDCRSRRPNCFWSR